MGTWVKVESPTFMGSWTSKVQPSLKGTTVGFIESIPVAVADTLFLYLLSPPTILTSCTLGDSFP